MFLHFGRNLTVVAYANLTIAKDISPACTLISPINASKVARTKSFFESSRIPPKFGLSVFARTSHRRDGREPTAILDNT